MTTVTSSIDSLTRTAADTAKGSGKSGTLDQSSFLKLMTTQLKTQDPFDPVDNQQMVAQMAQFSSVAGISEMNKSLSGIASDIKAARMGDAASWIGRSALVSSEIATPLADGAYAGQVTLPEDASAVVISLTDANGAVVHSETVPATEAGTLNWAWDGKGADGAATTGPLKLTVTASRAKGSGFMSGVETATWTRIGGVQSPAGGATAQLVTALGLIAPADAKSLS